MSKLSISEYYQKLSNKLKNLYTPNEAKSITKYYIEETLQLNNDLFILNFNQLLSSEQLEILEEGEIRLQQNEPVQYVTNTAWFYGLKFYVDKNVLIPRQETEILVDFIIKMENGNNKFSILDIGTGSGCIPITIKKHIPQAQIYALDISKEALEICNKNARQNNIEIFTKQHDILSDLPLPFDEHFDIVISNPPYVLNSEKLIMQKNVIDYEPEIALYVDDNNPLIFYEKILSKIENLLKPNGKLFFEINEMFAKQIIELNKKYGFQNNKVLKDLNQKDRIIICK